MKVLITFLVASMMSLSHVAPDPVNKDLIYGVWTAGDWDSGISYVQIAEFAHDKPGIEFHRDGTLTKRQNVGWCGTPPISYGNYDGTWEWTSENTLTVKYEFWGGTAEEDWVVRSIGEDEMVVVIKERRNDKRGR